MLDHRLMAAFESPGMNIFWGSSAKWPYGLKLDAVRGKEQDHRCIVGFSYENRCRRKITEARSWALAHE